MLLTIVIFVIILGLLVFVHELGHFITAKRMGVRVDEFGFGFPPRLFGVQRGNTTYSVNWIPLGGFVKIKGESGESERDVDSFAHKQSWQKASILAAGVSMNFLLAFLLFTIGFMIGMPQEITDDDTLRRTVREERIVIAEVDDGSPAARAGVRLGDTIIGIDGQKFESSSDIINYIREKTNQELAVLLLRADTEITINVTPEFYGDNDRALLGIGMIRAGLVQYGFFESIYQGSRATVAVTVRIVQAFGTILKGLFVGTGIGDEISGPVGVAVLTGQVAKLGFSYLLNFTAILSINLAILNILPFPALDGGRILFVLIEKAKGRPVNPKIEGAFHNVGFGLLLLLVAFVTYKDLIRYGSQIWSGLLTIFK